jgi:hypothetical protein
MLGFLGFLGSGLLSPRSMSDDPIVVMLNCKEREERDRLTEKWRDHKLAELNFVGIVVRLFLD